MLKLISGEFRSCLDQFSLKSLELAALLASLSDEPNCEALDNLLQEYAEVESIAFEYNTYLSVEQDLIARGEVLERHENLDCDSEQSGPFDRPSVLQHLAKRLREKFLDHKIEIDSPVLVEISTFSGVEDAELFVADAFKMYSNFVERQGWNFEW